MEPENNLNAVAVKFCPRCRTTKILGEFAFRSKAKGLRQLWCKLCSKAYDEARYLAHKECIKKKVRTYATSEGGRNNRNGWLRNKRRDLRNSVVEKLGGRCSHPGCRWLNLDGTLGCTDLELLHIDHVDGGGSKERKAVHCPTTYYQLILSDDTGKYQLLCANCNWKKRYENGELFRKIKE